jgi:AcrR family transcriptional regulator
MPKAQRPYHHGDLRRALLAEGAALIERDGVAALTLRELARRLDVSHAAPLNHFADKDALLAALAAQGFEELGDRLAEAEGRTAELRLRALGRAYVDFARRRPGHFRVMFGQGQSSAAPERVGDAGARAYELLVDAVTAALPPGRARSQARVREASFLAWSVVHGAAMLILDGPIRPRLTGEADEGGADALVEYVTAAAAATVSGKGGSTTAPR